MKKTLFYACLLSVSAMLFSCNPDDDNNPNGEGGGNISQERLSEGIYEPDNKINTVAHDDFVYERWSWVDRKLDHIAYYDGSSLTLGYDGDYLSTVTTENDDEPIEARFFYNGGKLSNYDMYQNNALAVSVNVVHNASNKISNANITISDDYINMLIGDFGGMKTLDNLLGKRVSQSLQNIAKLKSLPSSKFQISDKSVTAAYSWEGDNVVQEIISANISIVISGEELAVLETLFGLEIPDAIMSLLGSTGLPLQFALTDTLSYSYDDKINPYYYCWAEGVTANTLSRNNPLQVSQSGSESISISMMGQVIPLQDEPYESVSSSVYTYNDANCPLTITSDGSTKTITYKE